MSEGWEAEDYARVDRGLSLLGWTFIGSPTADDAGLLAGIATQALEYQTAGEFDDDRRDALASKAFDLIWPYVGGAEHRAAVVSDLYPRSSGMRHLIPLVDEVTLAYYRGYCTVALAGLFVVVERFLRTFATVIQPSFSKLREVLTGFPASQHRERADILLSGIYAHYDIQNPTPFFFNRHGLLHGIRGPLRVDRLNCARAFVLIDSLAAAELGKGLSGYIATEDFATRLAAYTACVDLASERHFLRRT